MRLTSYDTATLAVFTPQAGERSLWLSTGIQGDYYTGEVSHVQAVC